MNSSASTGLARVAVRGPIRRLALGLGLALTLALTASGVARAAIAQAPFDSLGLASELFMQGQEQVRQQDYAAASESFEASLGIRERRLGPFTVEAAQAQAALGGARGEMGEYAASVPLLRRSIETLGGPPVRDSVAWASALNSLGRVMYLMGNRGEARDLLEHAVAIREAKFGSNSREVGVSLNNLANVFASSGDLERARPVYERLVAVAEAGTPPDSTQLGNCLNNLANVVSDLGDWPAGDSLYRRALAVREAANGPRSPRVAITLVNMASLSEVEGHLPEAIEQISRALDIQTSVLGADHPLTAEMIVSRAALLHRVERDSAAFAEALIGERLTREHLRMTARYLPESNTLQYEASRISGLDIVMTIVAVPPAPDTARARAALDAVIHGRSVLLDEMVQRHRVVAVSNDSNLTKLEAEWAQAREQYAQLATGGMRAAARDTAYGHRVEAARGAAEAAEARLAEASAPVRRQEQEQRVGFADVASALPPASALVSFVRYHTKLRDSASSGPPRYVAFVTRSGSAAPRVVALGDAGAIDSLVERWRERIADEGDAHAAEVAYRRDAETLRARIWDPIIAAAGTVSHVFLVPDGGLQLVSFQTLPMGTDRYLVESGPMLHYLSTERDLITGEPATGRSGRLLAMGGIDFDQAASVATGVTASAQTPSAHRGVTPGCEAFRDLRFRPLPGSEREVREVVAAWSGTSAAPNGVPASSDEAVRAASPARAAGSVVLKLGAEATEEVFKHEALRARAIHLATHGYFVAPQCLSASAEGEASEGQILSPLLLSGLAMAGANQRRARSEQGEDGLLTSEEIATLDLGAAEWVVLSACGTGVGTIVTGEGVYGLRRAFQIAGARTLVMSLWNVNDLATRRWMELLYQARLVRGRAAAESVQDASRALIEELRARGSTTHPSLWGAFIPCGDWR